MSEVIDFTGDNGFYPGGLPSLLLPLGRHVDIYFPPPKRSRVSASAVLSEEPKSQPSIENLPDECLFEVFRRLSGGQERCACANVSKRWLALLSTICSDELYIEPDKCREPDPHAFLTRCLEGKKASDVRLAAISVGTSARGGLGKLLIRGNESTRRLTDFGLKAISRGCPSLKALSLWNLSSVGDGGLSAISTGCRSLEKLDLCQCPIITDKGLISIARSCPDLKFVTLESCANVENEGLKALGESCPNLKSVTVKNCPLVSDHGIAALFTSAGDVLAKVSLESLNISDVGLAVVGHYGSALTELALADLRNVNERGFWVMGKGQGLQKLRSLLLASCLGVSDISLDAIGHGCPDLKTLVLRKCPLVSDGGVVAFARAVGSLESLKIEEIHRISQLGIFNVLVNRKLKSLALTKCLGIKDVPTRFSSTARCDSLRSMTIRHCPGAGDFGLTVLGRLCPNVTHVDLTNIHGVTDNGIYSLLKRSVPGLVKVVVGGCVNMTDAIVSEITRNHGQTLEILNLEGCKNVTDASLMAVAKNCSVLSELDVSHCGITDNGIGMLAGAKQLGVQILSLAGCSTVSDKSVPFFGAMGKTLFGLNIQRCSGISSTAVNLLIEQLWRCDILS